jgi:ubiquinone/menaquinone biosynthesis C-methylase UbiE
MIRGRARLLALALALASLACMRSEATRVPANLRSGPTLAPASREPAATDTASVAGESVRPGINDPYFERGIDKSIAQLESEKREVVEKRDAIVAALGLAPGMHVADFGSGTGLFVAPISRALGPSGKLYAIDIVPSFLARLRELVTADSLTNVEVVAADAHEPGLAPGSVDLVFMCDVYHHVEYPSEVLPKLRAALRVGGRLIVIDFRRVPGETSAAMMKHVRADQQTFTAELEAAGFVFVRELGQAEGLAWEENYMLVFERGTTP